MAEIRNTSAGAECGSNFKKMLSDMGLLKQTVDKSIRRTDDVLRKYNSAKRSEDGDEQARVMSLAKSDAKSAEQVTKKDVTDAVYAANANTAKRLDELFGSGKTASAHSTAPVATTAESVSKSVESVKKTPVVQNQAKDAKYSPEKASTVKSESAKKVDTTSDKTRARLEELFGEQKAHNVDSANRLDELFGKANTKLDGIDKSVKEVKEPVLKRLAMNVGEKLLQLIMSPPGLLMISFVAGFIKGWLDQQPWFQFVKDILKSPIVKSILGGTVIALLLDALTGGLIGTIAKPLLGILGKGLGNILTKGLPLLIKGGLGLVKGLVGFMTTPVGVGVAALAGGLAIGYAGYKLISDKLQEMREEETKKINEKASTFASNDEAKEQNKSEIEKLRSGDGGEQYMQVSNGKGGFDMVKGHFDADGNFVIVEKMDEGGTFKAVEPDTAGIQVGDVAKKTKKMSFNWIAQSKKGITRVQFGQIEAPVKRAFMQYVDKNYCQTGELPAGTSTKLMSALLMLSAHYSVEGEGLANDDGEAGLKKQLADTWNTLLDIAELYQPGYRMMGSAMDTAQFVSSYRKVYGLIIGCMVPKSNRGAIMSAVEQEKFLFEKNYLQSDDWNHIAFAATVYQIWLDIFLNFMNQEFKTDFRSNTITKAEYDEAMSNETGLQSQALAISTSLATDVRIDNADKAKRESVKIAAAKKRSDESKQRSGNAIVKVSNGDGTFSYKHSDGTGASPEEIEEYDKSHPEATSQSVSPFSQTVTRNDINRLFDAMSEIRENSKNAADSSKRAEDAGTAAAITSAKGMSARMNHVSGRSASGAKVVSRRN